MRDALVAGLISLAGLGGVTIATAAPRDDAPAVFVFASGVESQEAWLRVLDAGYAPIATLRDNLVLAAPLSGGPDVWTARRSAGALVVLDGARTRACR